MYSEKIIIYSTYYLETQENASRQKNLKKMTRELAQYVWYDFSLPLILTEVSASFSWSAKPSLIMAKLTLEHVLTLIFTLEFGFPPPLRGNGGCCLNEVSESCIDVTLTDDRKQLSHADKKNVEPLSSVAFFFSTM